VSQQVPVQTWNVRWCHRFSPRLKPEVGMMKVVIAGAAILLALASISGAQAKGCLKGAAVGGVAGHFAGHHGLMGAAAGCVIGRHEANKRERERRQNEAEQPIR
jgi:hypothetical protein